jgi:hypothetical protein
VECDDDGRPEADFPDFFHGFAGVDTREDQDEHIIEIEFVGKGLIDFDELLLHDGVLTDHIDIFVDYADVDGEIHDRTSCFGLLGYLLFGEDLEFGGDVELYFLFAKLFGLLGFEDWTMEGQW